MNGEYDVFISFKNKDKDGQLTQDKELAYRIYTFLDSRKLKVFFSEVTLEELGIDS